MAQSEDTAFVRCAPGGGDRPKREPAEVVARRLSRPLAASAGDQLGCFWLENPFLLSWGGENV